MRVDSGGRRLLVDPWVIGSAYWRSWWHFPPSMPVDDEMLAADWIYLSHQHFDHFHYPSLRLFRRDVPVLVARYPIPSMERELERLGFTNVIAMAHGKTHRLEGGCELTSYQAGWIQDSALLVRAGGVTLLDLNDAKFEEPVLRQIIARHAPVDFMFRSHSAAQAYPDCYTSPVPADLALRRREDYIDDFIAAASRFRPRWAIPFASNVCFLHPETFDKNRFCVTPKEVARRFGEAGLEAVQVVVMLPHSSWDSESGFDLKDDDSFETMEARLAQMAREVSGKIEGETEREARKTLHWETFEGYMGAFLKALPPGLGWFFRARFAFYVAGEPAEWWVLDFGKRRVSRRRDRPDDVASITHVNPGLLEDAMEKGIVNFIDISKRLRVELAPGRVLQHFAFKELLTLYEVGELPLRRNLTPRALRVWWRRRREIYSYLRKALGGTAARSFRRSSGHVEFGPRRDPQSSPILPAEGEVLPMSGDNERSPGQFSARDRPRPPSCGGAGTAGSVDRRTPRAAPP